MFPSGYYLQMNCNQSAIEANASGRKEDGSNVEIPLL